MNLLRSFLTLPVNAPMTSSMTGVEVDGSIVPAAAQVGLNSQLMRWLQENVGWRWATASGTSATIGLSPNYWRVYTAGSATTITLDYAYNTVLGMQSPFLGQTWMSVISTNASTTIATPTLSDTAVTLAGTTTVTAAGVRFYQSVITQLTSQTTMSLTAGSTFTSIAQVGSTNAFTVTLGTNAISPTVGQLFGITVTAGTLPSGYYPIVKVTSATSFVIATGAGTVWTATAGTLLTANPSAPVFSPLVTVTGMAGTVLNTMVV